MLRVRIHGNQEIEKTGKGRPGVIVGAGATPVYSKQEQAIQMLEHFSQQAEPQFF